MNIRKYRPADKEVCLSLFRKNIGKSFEPEELPFFDHWLENHDEYPYFVVELENKIVACGGIYFDDRYDRAGLSWSMVDPEYQKRGIGRDLTRFCMTEIENAFPGSGCFIEATGSSAQFYIKLGFVVRETRRDGFNPDQDRYFLEYLAA